VSSAAVKSVGNGIEGKIVVEKCCGQKAEKKPEEMTIIEIVENIKMLADEILKLSGERKRDEHTSINIG
jgi:hypothetical protein